MKYFLYYLIIINTYGFFIMLSDKRKSQRKTWRIPESRLFVIALIFGSLGIWAGMYTFHHKTKHKKFAFGIPAILLFQIFILYRFGLLK